MFSQQTGRWGILQLTVCVCGGGGVPTGSLGVYEGIPVSEAGPRSTTHGATH